MTNNHRKRNADHHFSRAAPHNVYTSFAKLDTLNTAKGYGPTNYTSLPRKATAGKAPASPTAKTIDLLISSSLFYVHYDYDAASNAYLRSEGGAPHMATASEADRAGVRLAPKVVIALSMSYSLEADDLHSFYSDTGSGEAFIFQDGALTKGTWHKTDRHHQFSFTDANGVPIKLDPGQTWITMVQPDQVRVGG